ncbi:hypothetical protein D1007_04586 [Hordeum vulgare]|nr:hypothetical protein D1007_04586 [Hordeum vulgare]
MDFVEVPRLLVSEHRIEYSLPRACFVCNDDFKLIEEIDRNKLSLDKIDFGKRNLRRLAETSYARLEGCNETHCQNNNFVGADAQIPGIPSNPAMDGCDIGAQEVEVDTELAGCSNTNQNEAQPDIGLDKMDNCGYQGMEYVHPGPDIGEREKSVVGEVVVGDLKDRDVADEGQSLILSQGTVAALQGLAMELDDGPSVSLFKEGTKIFEWFSMDVEVARNYKEANKCMENSNHVVAP